MHLYNSVRGGSRNSERGVARLQDGLIGWHSKNAQARGDAPPEGLASTKKTYEISKSLNLYNRSRSFERGD